MSIDLYKKLLGEFIALKSVSTDSSFKSEINKTAEWLKNLFEKNNFKVELIEGYDNPIVLAEYFTNPNLETCLIYGHYDVQPADISDGWKSDPFTLTERDGRLFGRGAVDNKGQILMHIVSAISLIKENKLGYNLKFIIEGNEETGSPLFEKFILDHKDRLKCDFATISDGEILGEHPLIELGFRGGFNAKLKIKTSHTDLHSGLYGGAIPSASHELVKFLDKIYDPNTKLIKIEGFYDDVEEITEKIRKFNEEIPFDEVEYKKIAGVKAIVKEDNYNVYSQTALRPTIQITGLNSGYTGEGFKNIVPAESEARLNFRLVKNQNPEKIMQLFEKFVRENLPSYLDYTFECTDPYDGIKLDVNNKYVQKALELMEESYGQMPFKKYNGGGLPVVTYFDTILHIPQVLAPLGNEDCNMHGVDENMRMDLVERGLRFVEDFFKLLV